MSSARTNRTCVHTATPSLAHHGKIRPAWRSPTWSPWRRPQTRQGSERLPGARNLYPTATTMAPRSLATLPQKTSLGASLLLPVTNESRRRGTAWGWAASATARGKETACGMYPRYSVSEDAGSGLGSLARVGEEMLAGRRRRGREEEGADGSRWVGVAMWRSLRGT